MTLFEELKWRGLINSVTDEAVIEKINNGEVTFYLGADPTGDSLHVGHLLVYLFAKRLESVGNKPIFLIGGATASIGDPKPGAERQLLSRETIDHNASCLFNQVSNLFPAEMVNNYNWTKDLDILTFLRTYGKFFNVNYMINKETVKARLDSGISYAEFSYQILQALDFEHLYRTKSCGRLCIIRCFAERYYPVQHERTRFAYLSSSRKGIYAWRQAGGRKEHGSLFTEFP